MSDSNDSLLESRHLESLAKTLHQGAAEASQSLAKWIGKASLIEIDSLEQLPLEEATGLLAADEEPICFCSVEIKGPLSGEMILAFDDASGYRLSDMLQGQPGATDAWDEMAVSAALETTNIICCADLNALSDSFSTTADKVELLPTPPRFSRDYAESLMEFALMGQAVAADRVILAKTNFEIDGAPIDWTLLFVPDAQSMVQLPKLIERREAQA